MNAVAVSGTRRALRELADGTIRVQIDIDPRFRSDFFELFSEIDCGVALVPLAPGAGVEPVTEPATEPATQKTTVLADGPGTVSEEAANQPAKSTSKFPDGLCGLAVRWCNDPHFQGWCEEAFPDSYRGAGEQASDEERAAFVVKGACGVSSRKELDTYKRGTDKFKKLFLTPYTEARKSDGLD